MKKNLMNLFSISMLLISESAISSTIIELEDSKLHLENGVELKVQNNGGVYSRVISMPSYNITLNKPTNFEKISDLSFEKIVPMFNSPYSYVGITNNKVYARKKTSKEWVDLEIPEPIDLLTSLENQENTYILTSNGVLTLKENESHFSSFSNEIKKTIEKYNGSLNTAELNELNNPHYTANLLLEFPEWDKKLKEKDLNNDFKKEIHSSKIILDGQVEKNQISEMYFFNWIYGRMSFSCDNGLSKKEVEDLSKVKTNNETDNVTNDLMLKLNKEQLSLILNDNQVILEDVYFDLLQKDNAVCNSHGVYSKIYKTNDEKIIADFITYKGSPKNRKLQKRILTFNPNNLNDVLESVTVD